MTSILYDDMVEMKPFVLGMVLKPARCNHSDL